MSLDFCSPSADSNMKRVTFTENKCTIYKIFIQYSNKEDYFSCMRANERKKNKPQIQSLLLRLLYFTASKYMYIIFFPTIKQFILPEC